MSKGLIIKCSEVFLKIFYYINVMEDSKKLSEFVGKFLFYCFCVPVVLFMVVGIF